MLVAALLTTACSAEPSVVEGRSTAVPGATCVPAAAVADRAPEGFPELPAGTVLTAVSPASVSGRVAARVDDVVRHFTAELDRSGYVVQRAEDEGRAARLAFFGARGDATLDVALLTCPAGSSAFTLVLRSPQG